MSCRLRAMMNSSGACRLAATVPTAPQGGPPAGTAGRGAVAVRREGLRRHALRRGGSTLAGVSKGTLYLYYPSKEELFKAVVRQNLSS
jgi:hypothetical protein